MTNYRIVYKDYSKFFARLHHEKTQYLQNQSSYTQRQRGIHLKNYYTLIYHNMKLMYDNKVYETIVNVYFKFMDKSDIVDSYFTEEELTDVLERFQDYMFESLQHILKSRFEQMGIYYQELNLYESKRLYLILTERHIPSLSENYSALECYYIYHYFSRIRNDITTALSYLEYGKELTNDKCHILCLGEWGKHVNDKKTLKSAFQNGNFNALLSLIHKYPENPKWHLKYYQLLKQYRQNPNEAILEWEESHPFHNYIKSQMIGYECMIQIPTVNYKLYRDYEFYYRQYTELISNFSPDTPEYHKHYLEILTTGNPILEHYDSLQKEYETHMKQMYRELHEKFEKQNDFETINSVIHKISDWDRNYKWNKEIQFEKEDCFDFHIRIYKMRKRILKLEEEIKWIPEFGEQYFKGKQHFDNI